MSSKPYWVLALSLFGIAFAGPLVRLSSADPAAIAVWRRCRWRLPPQHPGCLTIKFLRDPLHPERAWLLHPPTVNRCNA